MRDYQYDDWDIETEPDIFPAGELIPMPLTPAVQRELDALLDDRDPRG